MFCGNCGKEINDDVAFCPNCGKSSNTEGTTNIKNVFSKFENINEKYGVGIMLSFVKKAFRRYMGLILWFNLILCTVSGGIIGYYLTGGPASRYNNSGNPILGIFIGLIVGVLINIGFGGFIATIINIDANIEELNNNNKLNRKKVINENSENN